VSAKFAGRQVTGSFFILFLLLGGSLGSPHKKQFSHNTFPKIMIGCGHILTCSSMWYDIIAWDSSNFMSLLGVHALCSLSQAIELLFLFNMMLNLLNFFFYLTWCWTLWLFFKIQVWVKLKTFERTITIAIFLEAYTWQTLCKLDC